MAVTPEEEWAYWEAKATELRRAQLPSVQATATKWAGLLSALLGMFGTVAFAGGFDTIDTLADPWAIIVKGLTTAAAVGAVVAIVVLSLAAGGMRMSRQEGLTAESVRDVFTTDTNRSLRLLNLGRTVALAVAALVLAGSTLVLWIDAEEEKASDPAAPTVVVVTGDDVVCGELQAGESGLHVDGTPLDQDVTSIVVVDACP